jgi:hypothetical protein
MDRDIVRFLIYFIIGGVLFFFLARWVFFEYAFDSFF